jgi:DNA-binding GntR family transcriptional regulator
MVRRGAGKTQEFTHAHIEVLRARDVAAARQAMLDEISETREAILDRAIREDGASWHLGA